MTRKLLRAPRQGYLASAICLSWWNILGKLEENEENNKMKEIIFRNKIERFSFSLPRIIYWDENKNFSAFLSCWFKKTLSWRCFIDMRLIILLIIFHARISGDSFIADKTWRFPLTINLLLYVLKNFWTWQKKQSIYFKKNSSFFWKPNLKLFIIISRLSGRYKLMNAMLLT